MNILEIFEVAVIIGQLEKCFRDELVDSGDDFAEIVPNADCFPIEYDSQIRWFSINPDKLSPSHRRESCIFIVSESEKNVILKAFEILKRYSKEMPEGTHFKERLLRCKQSFPPVFFENTKKNDTLGKVIPFRNFEHPADFGHSS